MLRMVVDRENFADAEHLKPQEQELLNFISDFSGYFKALCLRFTGFSNYRDYQQSHSQVDALDELWFAFKVAKDVWYATSKTLETINPDIRDTAEIYGPELAEHMNAVMSTAWQVPEGITGQTSLPFQEKRRLVARFFHDVGNSVDALKMHLDILKKGGAEEVMPTQQAIQTLHSRILLGVEGFNLETGTIVTTPSELLRILDYFQILSIETGGVWDEEKIRRRNLANPDKSYVDTSVSIRPYLDGEEVSMTSSYYTFLKDTIVGLNPYILERVISNARQNSYKAYVKIARQRPDIAEEWRRHDSCMRKVQEIETQLKTAELPEESDARIEAEERKAVWEDMAKRYKNGAEGLEDDYLRSKLKPFLIAVYCDYNSQPDEQGAYGHFIVRIQDMAVGFPLPPEEERHYQASELDNYVCVEYQPREGLSGFAKDGRGEVTGTGIGLNGVKFDVEHTLDFPGSLKAFTVFEQMDDGSISADPMGARLELKFPILKASSDVPQTPVAA